MRYFNLLIVSFLCIFSSLLADPSLILFFDVNGTIIVQDSATKTSLEAGLNRALAAHTFACWDERVKEPISYAEFVQSYLMPGATSTKQNKALGKFLCFLQATHHPATEAVQAQFDFLYQKLQAGKQLIFPSFYRLIAYLEKHSISYTVILRTFGRDLPFVQKELREHLGNTFICCEGRFKKGIFYTDNHSIEELQELYAFFQKGNMAVQDDHAWWAGHGKAQPYGKPFPLDLEDPSTLALFFDDHLLDRTIIYPIDVRTRKPLCLSSLVEKGYAIAVDTLKAIEDEEYFLHLVERAIKNRANTLKTAPADCKDQSACSDDCLMRCQSS